MVYKIIRIATYQALHTALEKLPPPRDGYRLYRGQTRDYGSLVVPAARLGVQNTVAQTRRAWTPVFINYLTQLRSWISEPPTSLPPPFVRSLLQGQQGRGSELPPLNSAGAQVLQPMFAAVLQHYGAPTEFLDCTTSLPIALWFGHNHLVREEVKILLDIGGGRLSLFQVELWSYEPNRSGQAFLYVIDARPPSTSIRHGSLADIRSPAFGARPMNQHAVLVQAEVADPKGGDLSDFIVAAFEYPCPLQGIPEDVRKWKTTYLFPPPPNDHVYDHLVRVPFANTSPLLPVMFRLVQVPAYVDDLFDAEGSLKNLGFIDRIRSVRPTWVFETLLGKEIPMHFNGSVRWASTQLDDAEVWILHEPTALLPVVFPSEEHEFKVPEGLNLFLEFSQIEFLARIGTGASDVIAPSDARTFLIRTDEKVTLLSVEGAANLRGIWMGRGESKDRDRYSCTFFFGWGGTMGIEGPIGFQWDHLKSSFRKVYPPELNAGLVPRLCWDPGLPYAKSGDKLIEASSINLPLDSYQFLLRYMLTIAELVYSGRASAESFPQHSLLSRYKRVLLPASRA